MTTHQSTPAVVLPFEEQGHGHTVVFVHGYISDLRVWANIRFRWDAPGRLLFPTLNGFGDAGTTPDPAEFGIEAHLRQLTAFITETASEPVHLVGWSYGATLALLLAARRPDLVTSVFSYEAGFSSLMTDPALAAQIQADRADMAGPAIIALREGQLDLAVQRVVDGACKRDGVFARLTAPTRRIFLDNAQTVPLMFAGQDAPSSGKDEGRLEDIACPATVSSGEYARPAYSLVADQAAKTVPSAHRQVIPRGLHVAPVTDPGAFVEAVTTHLKTATTKGR